MHSNISSQTVLQVMDTHDRLHYVLRQGSATRADVLTQYCAETWQEVTSADALHCASINAACKW
jgi:hypothetical protein